MIRYGVEPFVECSSRGDKRFSPFIATIRSRGNQSIQKLFEAGRKGTSVKVVAWMDPDCLDEDSRYLDRLWWEYLQENPDLQNIVSSASGFQNTFGIPGEVEQAEILWRIKCYFDSVKTTT